jgi:acid stress-induced BolA-like protein IbaG/YrbA
LSEEVIVTFWLLVHLLPQERLRLTGDTAAIATVAICSCIRGIETEA